MVYRLYVDQGVDDKEVKTRIMIFAQYRDSVNEITELLNRHRPLVRAMSFIGQSSAGKTTKGFTQKEQLKVFYFFPFTRCTRYILTRLVLDNSCLDNC